MDSFALLGIAGIGIGFLLAAFLKKKNAKPASEESSPAQKVMFTQISASVSESILEVCQANAGKPEILEAYVDNWVKTGQIPPDYGPALLAYYKDMTIRREEIKCPACGQTQDAANKTCIKCGAFLGADDQVACPQCGRRQNAAHAVCAVCGADMKAGRLETEEIDYSDTLEMSFDDDAPASQNSVPPSRTGYADQEQQLLQKVFADLQVFSRDVNLPAGYGEKYAKGMIFQEGGYADCSSIVAGMTTTHRYLILSNRMQSRVYSQKCIGWKHHEAGRYPLFKVLGTHTFQGKTGIILLHIPENAVQTMKKGESPQEKALLAEAVRYFEAACAKPPVPEVNDPEWLEFCQEPIGLDLDGRFLKVL